MIKGFEYQLAESILQDLQRRLQELTSFKYNAICPVKNYEKFFSINRSLSPIFVVLEPIPAIRYKRG